MSSATDQEYAEAFTADDHRRITLGHELLPYMETFPDDELTQAILDWLNVSLTDATERALFSLPPIPAGEIVPFKPRSR